VQKIMITFRASRRRREMCRGHSRLSDDDQGDNPGQDNRGLDGVLYKL